MNRRQDEYTQPLRSDSHILHLSYEYLNEGHIDIGFRSAMRDGQDYHQVTREVTLSMQKFNEGHLINLLYVNGQPIHVELDNEEIIPYYSDFIELRYVLSGHFEFEFEGAIEAFEENEICFLNSSVLHREFIPGSECVVINLNISRAYFNERFLNSIAISPLQKFLRTNILRLGNEKKYLKFTPVSSNISEIREYLFAIMNEVRFQKVGYLDISRGYLTRLMDTLATGYRYNFTGDDSTAYYDSLFEAISDYMKQHLATVSMQDLIDTFHYRKNFFNLLIRRYTGLTYSNYLVSLRIESAKDMLETSHLPVDEIIYLVGYHNRGFFYKRFYEATGMNPAEYRRSIRMDGA